MIRLALSALVALVVVAPVSAQTVIEDVDFSQLDFGGQVLDFEPVDDDGNPDTMAWLIKLLFTAPNGTTQNGVRLVVQQASELCKEDPFDPQAGLSPFAPFDVIRVGRRDMIKLISSNPFSPGSTKGRIVSIDRVLCR